MWTLVCQIESQGGRMERSTETVQQDLERAEREILLEVARPPGYQL